MTAGRHRASAYDITGRLGRGVWSARRGCDGRAVAVKVGASGVEADPRLRPRHPHLVPVIDVVPTPAGPALVLPAAVCSLHELVARRGPLELGEAVAVGTAVAAALGALHERGLVHGDVHPGNVLVAADGSPLLADLDAATPIGGAALAWTPGFASPETTRRRASTPAADQWSLAATCAFASSGRPAPALASVLDRARRAEPTERFPDIHAFGRALAEVAAARALDVPLSAQVARTPLPAPPVTRRFGPRPAPPGPERRGPGLIARAARWWRAERGVSRREQ